MRAQVLRHTKLQRQCQELNLDSTDSANALYLRLGESAQLQDRLEPQGTIEAAHKLP